MQQTVGGQNIFLYQVFLDQRFWDNKASLKIGRFGASDDFNGASSIYSRYLNNGIDGDIRNVLFDTQFSAYPFATWAARLRVEPTKDTSRAIRRFSDLEGHLQSRKQRTRLGHPRERRCLHDRGIRLDAGILEATGRDD